VAHHLRAERFPRGAVICRGDGDLVEAANGMVRFITDEGEVGKCDGTQRSSKFDGNGGFSLDGTRQLSGTQPISSGSSRVKHTEPKRPEVSTVRMRNAAKDAASAALAARVSNDATKMFYVICSGEFTLQAHVPRDVPSAEVTPRQALAANPRVDRPLAVLGRGTEGVTTL